LIRYSNKIYWNSYWLCKE